MIHYRNFSDILHVPSIVEWYNEHEIIVEKKDFSTYNLIPEVIVTIEPLEDSKYILRGYSKNKNKRWEINCKDGMRHGKHITWYESGKLCCECNFENNMMHGKHTTWFENGSKYWEEEYKDGQIHGKSIGWFEDGVKNWEYTFEDGKLKTSWIDVFKEIFFF